MIKLPKEVKLELFNLIQKQPNAFGLLRDREGILPFLLQVWDLRIMPSTDDRFKNAYDDVYQHTINNDDWTDKDLFIDALNLLEDDEKFTIFIETVVNPTFRANEDEIVKFVLLIDPYLLKYGHALSVDEFTPLGYPVYRIKEKQPGDEQPSDLKKNDIPFFTNLNPSGRIDRPGSHTAPEIYPSFMLVFNTGWNDYSIWSTFYLYYYSSENERHAIGEVKIISTTEDKYTSLALSETFTTLDDTFCSLGQSLGYYKRLKTAVGRDFESVLYALKDVAFFADIQDRFSKDSKFKYSLIRDDEAERLLRIARYTVYDYDPANLYKFKYAFQPLYASEPVQVMFEFDNESDYQNRIYALIGKNGAGKTQLITSLPDNISRRKDDFFFPSIPFFSKVIAVSYSVFDQFDIPKKTSSFNYVYCGLRDDNNEELTDKRLVLRFHRSWKKITELERIDQWRKILLNFISQDIIESFIIPEEIGLFGKNNFKVNIEGFHDAKLKLSSGQSIVLYIISEIVAHIRFDSLLLYDEPETHLHPTAITELMNTIYELVNEFESYCIIATHSPMIIRELFSKNVYVIERHENTPSVRRIGIESFGENIAVLTDEVFGNKDTPKQYKKIIDQLSLAGRTFEQIVEDLEFDHMPLSLNTRLYIKSVIKERDA